jgi:hypothetical protein
MNQHQKFAITPKLCRAIQDRADAAGLSPEAWMQRQLEQVDTTGPFGFGSVQGLESEALYELALRHFRDLELETAQARELALAMQNTLESGEPQSVTISPEPNRRYVFHRRMAALIVRLGEGHIRLPLHVAARLARVLRSLAEVRPRSSIAA